MASWWNAEAADRGVYHQYTDIDPVVRKLLGPVKERKRSRSDVAMDILAAHSQSAVGK